MFGKWLSNINDRKMKASNSWSVCCHRETAQCRSEIEPVKCHHPSTKKASRRSFDHDTIWMKLAGLNDRSFPNDTSFRIIWHHEIKRNHMKSLEIFRLWNLCLWQLRNSSLFQSDSVGWRDRFAKRNAHRHIDMCSVLLYNVNNHIL